MLKHFQSQVQEKFQTMRLKNEQLRQELVSDEKELAEHTMLVDLGTK